MDDLIIRFPDEFFCDPVSYIYSAPSVGVNNVETVLFIIEVIGISA